MPRDRTFWHFRESTSQLKRPVMELHFICVFRKNAVKLMDYEGHSRVLWGIPKRTVADPFCALCLLKRLFGFSPKLYPPHWYWQLRIIDGTRLANPSTLKSDRAEVIVQPSLSFYNVEYIQPSTKLNISWSAFDYSQDLVKFKISVLWIWPNRLLSGTMHVPP